MAPLSAAALRAQVREILLSCGLRGFVRIGAEGRPLLLTDAVRRAGEAEKATFFRGLEQSGFVFSEEAGLLWINPSEAYLRQLIRSAATETLLFSVSDWNNPLCEAESLALRFLSVPLFCDWTEEGKKLILETLRLPDPKKNSWRETDILRPYAAELLRRKDRSALHASGLVLAFRIVRMRSEN